MRYWDGAQWTEHVVTQGAQSHDPLPPVHVPPTFSANAVDYAEPAPRRTKGWRLHIILSVVTFGVWLLAIPAVIAWRRGERGWTAGLAVAAVVAFVTIGNALPEQEQAFTAAAEVPSSPSAVVTSSSTGRPSNSPTGGNQATPTPAPTRSSTIAAFADGAAAAGARPAAPQPTSAPAAKPTTTAAKPTTKLEPATSTAKKPATSTTTKKPTTATTKPTTTAAAAKDFANCTEMRKVYPHGVGKPGAIDHTTGAAPVTTFHISASLYAANSESDRDDDGIACEQK